MDKIRHAAIIMDGNNRWAKGRGLPGIAGHRAGAEAVLRAVKSARKLEIEYLTLYAFSTENWKRPVAEVNGLMKLLEEFLEAKLPDFQQENVRLKTIGRTGGLPPGVRKKLSRAIEATAGNTAGTLILALNYGGRAEIADAAKRIALAVREGRLDPAGVDEKLFGSCLYDPAIPDPELMIRTSGEFRLSNFLLWELAYSEIVVVDKLWPDFDHADFEEAVVAFRKRHRRFGGR